MFVNFFFELKERGISISPASFLILHKAFDKGLIATFDDFYTTARSVLIKSERYFDLYDRAFARYFKGIEAPEMDNAEFDRLAELLADEWSEDPKEFSYALGMSELEMQKLAPRELAELLIERMTGRDKRRDGDAKRSGAGGTSPVGASGNNPEGMRVGGISKSKTAVKLALERRYKDYSIEGPLTCASIGEALKRLRNMVPCGPRDKINVNESIYQTVKNGGEIELAFDKNIKDRLKVFLFIDNGGWSMDPHIPLVQTLFDHVRDQFKDLKTFYFHNTIFDTVWSDPKRYTKQRKVEEFERYDPETRLIFTGDAGMSTYELLGNGGSFYAYARSGKPSIERLTFLRNTFAHCVWLNPVRQSEWQDTETISIIGDVIPMFPLTVDGIEKAVSHLMSK